MSTQPKTRTVSAKPEAKPRNSASHRKTRGKKTAKLPEEPKLVIDTPGLPPGGNPAPPPHIIKPPQPKAS
jgi:hypothetical protein